MLEELDHLEGKLSLLLERWQALRRENLRLRQRLVALENENKLLTERLVEARQRLEKVYDQLPD